MVLIDTVVPPTPRHPKASRRRAVLLVLAIVAVLTPLIPITATRAHAAAPVFQEFLDNSFRSPQGMTMGSDGNLWITETFGGLVRMMTPSGQFTNFHTSDRHVKFITTGADGNLWFTESSDFGVCTCSTGGHIGRIDIATHALTEFPIPTAYNKPYAIATGADGNVWFTEDGSKIGRVTPAGVITEFTMPTQQGLADDIAPGPDGNMWFPESLSDKIASITPSGDITEWQLPSGAGPEGLVTGPDHNLWIVESGSNNIARLNVKTHALTEFPIPTAQSDSQLITVGPDGALYFTEALNAIDAHGAIGRITTDGTVSEFNVPTPRRPFDEPFTIISGPGSQLWFTEEIGSEIVSMTVPTGVGGTAETGTTSSISRSPHQPPPFTEYALPEQTDVAPFAMTTASDGNVWFTELNNNAIGRLQPDGTITEFPATSGSQGMTTGPDGAIWYCGGSGIVRLTTTGVESDFATASSGCTEVVTGADGNLWYTSYGGVVGRLSPSGNDTEFSIANDGYIAPGPDGNLWVSEAFSGTFGQDGTLRRIAPDGSVTDFPVTGASPTCCGQQIITAGPDGNMWYAGVVSTPQLGVFRNVICRLVISTGSDTCFHSMVPPSVGVVSLVSGPNNSIWYSFGGNGNGPAGVARMTTDGTIASLRYLPAGFATPEGLAVGRSPANPGAQGNGGLAIYVAESQTNRIAVTTSG
ncbi:MAG: virginiamycin B lyase family protein [Candidatus Dormibacteria bacterium]